MIRLVSKAALLAVACLLAASVAFADVPDPSKSTINWINGYNAGAGGAGPFGFRLLMAGHSWPTPQTADAQPNYGTLWFSKTMYIKDGSGAGVNNAAVTLEFNACGQAFVAGVSSGLKLGSIQPGATGFPITIDATNKTVTAFTEGGGTGRVVFKVCGMGNHKGGPSGGNADPDAPANCIRVTANGREMGFLSAAYFDHNGADCINVADFGLFSNDYSAPQPAGYRVRSDYNFDNVLNVADFGLFSNAYNQNGFGGGTDCSLTGPTGGSTGPPVPGMP